MSFLKVKPKGGRKVHLIDEPSNTAIALCGLASKVGWQHVSIPVTCSICLRDSEVRVPPTPKPIPVELELEGYPRDDA